VREGEKADTTTMTALTAEHPSTLTAGAPETAVPDDGPYRIVLTRLQRLVTYRAQLRGALAADAGNQRAASEMVRVGHMIREVHRAVSLNAGARLQAQRIDPEAPVSPAPARLTRL
jgi:hypothetical protein